MAAPLLEIDGVSKQYGSHTVLRDVSLTLQRGETAALLGENGAGKSTLAKILAGAVRPNAGRLRRSGREVSFSTPREALLHGVSLIPQELVYVPKLTAAENICLGRWPRRLGLTSAAAVRRRAAAEARHFGFDIPLEREMTKLSLAQQQMVEILKAVARRSEIIILDEPTAALNKDDSERLLELVERLARGGVAAIYISHRLDEVFRACQTVHVLRNGSLVHSSPVDRAAPREIIGAMLGRPMDEATFDKQHDAGEDSAVLSLRDWNRQGIPSLRGVSFDVHRGEIVGLYGLLGAGAETVAETLGGLHPDVTGETLVNGRAVKPLRNPRRSRRAGIAYVPADRKSQGLVLTLTIQKSLSMLNLRGVSRFGLLRLAAERNLARQLWSTVRIRARALQQEVAKLSGGNQQKVLVGSRLATRPPLLVLHEPTRGVDVGARLELHRILRRLAAEGTAILLVTSDIEEAVLLSDRLLIIREGAVVRQLVRPDETSQGEALRAAGGIE